MVFIFEFSSRVLLCSEVKILDFQVSVNCFIVFLYLKLAVIFYNGFSMRTRSAFQAGIQSVLDSACLGQIFFSFFLNNQPANKQVGA